MRERLTQVFNKAANIYFDNSKVILGIGILGATGAAYYSYKNFDTLYEYKKLTREEKEKIYVKHNVLFSKYYRREYEKMLKKYLKIENKQSEDQLSPEELYALDMKAKDLAKEKVKTRLIRDIERGEKL